MEKNIKIVLNENETNERILVNLEDDFDNLEVLSLKISSTDVYRKTSSDFGVVVGRVQTANGYGLQNARVSIFVPIDPLDKARPEILELYPFETVNDQFPNGVRYNLLPRTRNQNPSHRAVGNLPTINDLVHYPQYLEVMEKYYKYTATTNESGDYMIFGVPVGSHNIMMDFDLFDTRSFEISANDLVETTTEFKTINDVATAVGLTDDNNPNKVPNYIYDGFGNFNVEVKTNINEMPNIFNEVKQVNVASFWGDEEEGDIGITRCDFKINYRYQPTAIFFGWASNTSASFYAKTDGSVSETQNPIEIFGEDTSLGRITSDIWPANDLMVVVYRLDDKLTPGSRLRVGAFKAEKGTGVFRIALPMYMDYFKINQFGDMVPTDDTENSIPTKGYYAFEIYDISESYQTRIPWGGHWLFLTPGVRIPASPKGETLTGGWEGTTSGLFEYDLVNRKRKFYTIKTKYNKHREDNVGIGGNDIFYIPRLNPNKDVPWTFPINRDDLPEINDVEVIGSIIMPRYEFKIQNTNSEDPTAYYYNRILNIINIPQTVSYNEKVRAYEYHVGIGAGLNGKNSGNVFTDIFSGDDFISQDGNNFYGDRSTYNYGDNADGPLNLSLFAIELAKNEEATPNDSGVHRRFTQAYSKNYTHGVFISSTDKENKFPVLETSIYDITDDLQDLIDNKVYTSYGFYTGNVEPTGFNAEISNRYKGNFYYFGYWDQANVLKTIEKNYFTQNE